MLSIDLHSREVLICAGSKTPAFRIRNCEIGRWKVTWLPDWIKTRSLIWGSSLIKREIQNRCGYLTCIKSPRSSVSHGSQESHNHEGGGFDCCEHLGLIKWSIVCILCSGRMNCVVKLLRFNGEEFGHYIDVPAGQSIFELLSSPHLSGFNYHISNWNLPIRCS